ncbi:hypothetical protein Tco_0271064 [Tanacetum coccineum]
MDVKTGFLNGDLEEEVYMKQSEVFIMPGNEHKYMGEADVILGIRIKREDKVNTPLDPTIKLMPNTSRDVDQLEYSRAIGCLMYVMISTRPDIAYVVGKLSRYTSNPSTHHWHAIMRVFLLGEGAISWASKKQTCITDSTMEVEFVALTSAGKEAEWLRNLIYEISLWPKPISSISIHCDSATTLAKAYCQI